MSASSLLIVLRLYVLANTSAALQSPPHPNSGAYRGFFSIAIWNRNKVVVAMAISVWVVSAGFFLQGKSLFTYLVGDRELNSTLLLFDHRCRASKRPISISLSHVLIQSIASLCMGTRPIPLCTCQLRE
jgi:hypothetical protein